jgi:hypothetical protein
MFVGEFHDDIKTPRAPGRCVRATTGVVRVKSRREVRGQTGQVPMNSSSGVDDGRSCDGSTLKMQQILQCTWLANRSSFGAGRPPSRFAATVGNLRFHLRRLVAQIFPRWNPLTSWMRQIEDFQRAA